MSRFPAKTRLLALLPLFAALLCFNAGATQVDPPEGPLDDAGYLLQLGLMRGHLPVGHELFRLGHLEAAKTHSKHPADELYASLQPSFAERGGGFAAELAAHAEAVESGDDEAVGAAYGAVVERIGAHERAVRAAPPVVARVVVELVRTAAAEYAIGIVDGKPENAHEYQDARGFTRVAPDWAQRADHPAFTAVVEELRALDQLWPELEPPSRAPHSASRLYGAAAEVEILTLRPAAR